MGGKEKLVRGLRSATCDKEGLNRQILRLKKCFCEVEKQLNRKKKK